jgi:hypothetical protein
MIQPKTYLSTKKWLMMLLFAQGVLPIAGKLVLLIAVEHTGRSQFLAELRPGSMQPHFGRLEAFTPSR